jgi:hypothetical protein
VGRGPSIAGIVEAWLISARSPPDSEAITARQIRAKAGTVIVTVIAGPLNYLSVNPKIQRPQPSP